MEMPRTQFPEIPGQTKGNVERRTISGELLINFGDPLQTLSRNCEGKKEQQELKKKPHRDDEIAKRKDMEGLWKKEVSPLVERNGRITFVGNGEATPMSTSRERSEALRGKVEELIRYAEGLRDELDRVRKEKEELAGEIEKKKGRIGELEKQVERLEEAAALSGSSRAPKGTIGRIDGMIREVDRCIALLED